MPLPNKTVVEAHYAACLTALRAIDQPSKDAAFAPLQALVVQCQEALIKLRCRELVGGRPADNPASLALATALADLQRALTRARASVEAFIDRIPD